MANKSSSISEDWKLKALTPGAGGGSAWETVTTGYTARIWDENYDPSFCTDKREFPTYAQAETWARRQLKLDTSYAHCHKCDDLVEDAEFDNNAGVCNSCAEESIPA